MRNARKVHVVAALVAAICSWLLVSAGGAAAAQQKIAWAKCHGGPFQCGTLQVPLDYDQPNGRTIGLGLTRLRATDPEHRIGSLVINPGGPGGPGAAFIVEAGQELFTPEVRARYDLVGFDPRGVNSSAALRCFGNDRQWEPFFTPFAFPMNTDELDQWIVADHFLDDACARRGGAIAEHMSTANVAHDMDRTRAALGDARLHYSGVSYGSFLGNTYANMFPDRVGRLVIDGVLDPVAWTTGVGDEAQTIPFSTREHSDAGAWATLQEFFRLCDAGGDRCAFSGGAEDRFAQLADDLLAAPKVVPFPDGSEGELDYSNLVGITLGFLGYSPDWPELAQLLADFESAPASKRVRVALRRYSSRSSLWVSHRSFPRYFNALEGGPAVFCTDSDNPDSYDSWFDAGVAADATAPYFGRLWTWVSGICADWPFADSDRYTGPWDHATANPVLVVGNQFDPATRYENAQKVAATLPGARLLTLHAWGHTSGFLSSCADEAVARYLVDGTLPAVGTVCEQDEVPFAQ
jgi:pimeloyl-ACP methyl ester carboxylesterase